jgi:hypothetical protein
MLLLLAHVTSRFVGKETRMIESGIRIPERDEQLWLSFYVKPELQYPKYSRRTKHERLLP